MNPARLSKKEHTFFGLVARAAFSNPLSEEVDGYQRRLLDQFGGGSKGVTGIELGESSAAVLREKIDAMDRSNTADFTLFQGLDRSLMRTALLYEVFHRFIHDFDRLISKQIDSGESSCKASFAAELLDRLSRRGFLREEAVRYLGFFFQLRRAYFFISTSLVGESLSMRELRRHLWNSVFTCDMRWYEDYLWNRMEDFSTLLLGETGTGKGTAAAAIGRSGFIPFDERSGCFTESFTSNFMAINLSQYPETLIESELFGHRKGAFTGAIDHYGGVLARCRPHGAIFLDEIGDVSPQVQIKLLQVLQERSFSPVGSHEKMRFGSRVIAATNKEAEKLREQGAMRDDFYYRLCSNLITVPPLRIRLQENSTEIDLLIDHLLQGMIGQRSPRMVRTIGSIIENAVGSDYPWPGNVRELEQAVRRILLTRDYTGDHPSSTGTVENLMKDVADGQSSAGGILTSYCTLLYERHGTYEAVARITRLDRRTVKKYIEGKGGKG